MGIRVGKAAPDFAAQAYWRGEIKEIRLSDYRGKWVLVFFYPADFTFV
jgi:alkyl hydroperoxide reductase subunit AhpC